MQRSSQLPDIPPLASSHAWEIDAVFWLITGNAVFFTLAIVIAILFLCVKYRRGNQVDRSNPPTHNNLVEVVWTVVPLMIALGIFTVASIVFLRVRTIPADAMTIYVTGKQWMWKVQHPEGRWENNELHVPLGKSVQLVMTSEDVIHSFYIPAFRIKQDVIPGDFTRMWFKPTRAGVYPLYCAEFCGAFHSTMVGTVTVMPPGEYQEWLATGSEPGGLAAMGKKLFSQHGCAGCHADNSVVKAPPLQGIFGRAVPIQRQVPGKAIETTPATTVLADERYIYDSIVLPDKEIAAGYPAIMPSFRGKLSESEIFQLMAYIKSLGGVRRPASQDETQRSSEPLSPEDYRSRVGFEPEPPPGVAAGSPPNR